MTVVMSRGRAAADALVAGVLLVCVSAGAMSVPARSTASTSTSAATHPIQEELDTGKVVVHTSKRTRLVLWMTAFHYQKSRGDGFNISLQRGSRELHKWGLPARSGAFRIATDGGGRLTTGEVAPYAKVSLALRNTGPGNTKSCVNGATETTYPVSVAGSVHFDTHSRGKHRWGRVAARALHFPRSTVTDLYGGSYCVPNASSTCPPIGVSYTDLYPIGPGSVEGGQTQGGSARITILRDVQLGAPKGATREDVVHGHTRTLTVHDPASKATLRLSPASSFITGHAILSAKKYDRRTCSTGVRSTAWDPAAISSRHQPLGWTSSRQLS
jgi:hypothetical protein